MVGNELGGASMYAYWPDQDAVSPSSITSPVLVYDNAAGDYLADQDVTIECTSKSSTSSNTPDPAPAPPVSTTVSPFVSTPNTLDWSATTAANNGGGDDGGGDAGVDNAATATGRNPATNAEQCGEAQFGTCVGECTACSGLTILGDRAARYECVPIVACVPQSINTNTNTNNGGGDPSGADDGYGYDGSVLGPPVNRDLPVEGAAPDIEVTGKATTDVEKVDVCRSGLMFLLDEGGC